MFLINGAVLVLLLLSISARADWHYGAVTSIAIGYDGLTVTVDINGWDRTDCTCYAAWPTYMCLDRSRISFKEEMAMVLSAKARGSIMAVNIDETTCKVIAIHEPQ